jgi:hypothetical protein
VSVVHKVTAVRMEDHCNEDPSLALELENYMDTVFLILKKMYSCLRSVVSGYLKH